MTIRIGANPIGWSNDDLQDVGGATPLETCLAEANEAGFTGMELGHNCNPPLITTRSFITSYLPQPVNNNQSLTGY